MSMMCQQNITGDTIRICWCLFAWSNWLCVMEVLGEAHCCRINVSKFAAYLMLVSV
jgi:hypothetical protein